MPGLPLILGCGSFQLVTLSDTLVAMEGESLKQSKESGSDQNLF